MRSLLHPDIPDRLIRLSQEFASAHPFHHVVIDNFLDPQFCGRLLSEFPAFDEKRALNELGAVGRKAVVPNIAEIGPAYKEFDSLMRNASLLELIGNVSGMRNLLYDPDYIGGGTHENLQGQDLDLHVDFNYHPTRLWHRRLNLIVFLNPEWEQSWGGCLELHSDPWNPSEADVKIVVPLANRAVLFETTETSWHGFSRITLPEDRLSISRRSIAVYFYTKERPLEQAVPAHGTIYVPRPLPENFRAGYTLEQADVDTLQVMMERRNAQLRFLYERELEFSQALSGISRSLSFRLGRALTWPARKVAVGLRHKRSRK